MTKKLLSVFLLILMGSAGLIPGVIDQKAYAAECKSENNFLGIPPWYAGLCKPDSNVVQINSENPMSSITRIILNIIAIAIRLAGYAAVGFVIWGGIKYMLAAGDSNKIVSAKKTITNALIGLLIALSAVAIVNFITSGF